MTVLTRPIPGDLFYRARWAFSGISWVGLAALLAGIQALAAFLDWKLGVVVAVALVVGAVLTVRPPLLLPLAVMTVMVEGLTFSGAAVTRLLAPAALLLAAAEILRGTVRVRPAAPLAFTGAYVAWGFASGMWSAEVAGTRFMLQSLAIALIFLFAFAAFLNTEVELRRLLYVFAFASALMGGLSVLAFGGAFGQEGNAIPYLQLLQGGRGQGGVGDPDFFAGIQLVAIPLILVLASDAKDKHMRIVLNASVLVVLASVFTTLSRGSYLAFIVLAIGLIASRPEKVFRSRREKAAALLVLALGMVVFFSRPFVREEVVGRAQSIYAPKTRDEKSGAGRTNLWKAAIRTAGEHPVTGVGLGTFPHISQELIFHTPGVDLEVLQIREGGDNFVAHNTYVGTAAELGFVGLFLYLGVIFSTGLMLRRISNRALALGSDFVGRVSHALLIGLATWAVVIVFLSGETARMFWIIVGITLALPKLLPEPQARLGDDEEVAWSPPRPVLRAAPVPVAAPAGLAPPRPVGAWRLLAPGERPLVLPPAAEPLVPVAPPVPEPQVQPVVDPPVPEPQAQPAVDPQEIWLPPRIEWLPPPEFPAAELEERVRETPRRERRGERFVQLGAAFGLLYALALLAIVLFR